MMRSITKITFKPRWQTNWSVVLVLEWWVNTQITELGDIARHSARWRGINRNFKKKKKKNYKKKKKKKKKIIKKKNQKKNQENETVQLKTESAMGGRIPDG